MAVGRLNESARRRQEWRNRMQALLLLGGMVLALALCAWLLFGEQGLLWSVLLGGATLLWRPRVRPEWVLRMYRARPLPYAAAPELHQLVAAIARRAGLARVPTLYYVPSSMLNAFAVGRRDDAAIGVTDGILRRLTPRELAGVLAHEMSHIRSDDLWVMNLADSIGRVTHAFAYSGLLLLVFSFPMVAAGSLTPLLVAIVLMAVPTVVTLLQLALSRSREYDADLDAAQLTGDPAGLASALRTLHVHEGRTWERILVPRGRMPDPLLLRTHPSTEERIRRLMELAPVDVTPLTVPEQPVPRGFTLVTQPPRLRYPGIWR